MDIVLYNMNIGYIYKITCLVNNRIYVGSKLSKNFVESYWGSSKNEDFWNDLNQYGKENFKREILCWCTSVEELREKEHEYILLENALTYKGGYNQALGAHTIIFDENVRKKMRKAARNRWNNISVEERQAFAEKKRQQALDPNGTMQSAEYKEKMRKVSTGFRTYTNGKIDIKTKGPCPEGFYPGTSNPNKHLSRKMSLESRQKMSEQRIGRVAGCHWWNNGIEQKFCKECPGNNWIKGRLNPHWNQREIQCHKCYCVEKDIIFNSVKEAAEWLNIPNRRIDTVRCNITRCCNGKCPNIYGYHWKYVD